MPQVTPAVQYYIHFLKII